MKNLFALILVISILIHTFAFAPVAVAATDVVNDATLSTDLVACWELDEDSGVRADSYTGDLNLTDNNTVLSGTINGVTGADFEVDNDESLSRAYSSGNGLDISGDASFAFWWKPETAIRAAFAGRVGAVGNRSFYIQYTGAGHFDFNVWTAKDGGVTGLRVNQSISAGTEYFVVMTLDASAGTFTLYINGSSVGSDTDSGTIGGPAGDATADFYMSSYNGTTLPVDGVMSRFGVWSRLLDSTDVTALYNSGSGIPCAATSGGGDPAPSDRKRAIQIIGLLHNSTMYNRYI